MSSLARTGQKPKSTTSQLADADSGLPDIAEAEAVLLDLARVFADPALNALPPVLNQLSETGPLRPRMCEPPTLRPNIALCWSRYRRLSSWHISTGVSARRM